MARLDAYNGWLFHMTEGMIALWDPQARVSDIRIITSRDRSWTAEVLLTQGGRRVFVTSRSESRRVAKEQYVRSLLKVRGLHDFLPRILYADPRGCHIGRPFMITEGVEGKPLREVLPDYQNFVLEDFPRFLQDLHSTSLERFGFLGGDGIDGPTYGTWRAYLRRILCRTLAQERGLGRALGTKRILRLQEMFRRVSAQTSEIRPRLCHGDIRSANILITTGPHAPRLAAVVDWEFAESADPLWDLGCAYANSMLLAQESSWWHELCCRYLNGVFDSSIAKMRILLYSSLKLVDFLCWRPHQRGRTLELIDQATDRFFTDDWL